MLRSSHTCGGRRPARETMRKTWLIPLNQPSMWENMFDIQNIKRYILLIFAKTFWDFRTKMVVSTNHQGDWNKFDPALGLHPAILDQQWRLPPTERPIPSREFGDSKLAIRTYNFTYPLSLLDTTYLSHSIIISSENSVPCSCACITPHKMQNNFDLHVYFRIVLRLVFCISCPSLTPSSLMLAIPTYTSHQFRSSLPCM